MFGVEDEIREVAKQCYEALLAIRLQFHFGPPKEKTTANGKSVWAELLKQLEAAKAAYEKTFLQKPIGSTPEPEPLKTEEGWAMPLNSIKFHFFDEDARSLCRKWAFFGELSEDNNIRNERDCFACRKKLEKRKAKP